MRRWLALVSDKPRTARLAAIVVAALLLWWAMAWSRAPVVHWYERAANRTQPYPTYAPEPGPPLTGRARILCWVLTTPATLPTKGDAVNRTWLRRCDVGLFMSSAPHDDPAVINISPQEGRQHLTTKTMQAFKYAYDHHFHDSEWFVKADDDTYLVTENLRSLLANYSPSDALYLGHHFKMHVRPNGYNSGGAGYVLSKQALFRLATLGYGNPELCNTRGADEDVEMGRCMQNLDVRVVDTRDASGRNRFHAYSAAMHLGGGLPRDYGEYDRYGVASGPSATSPQAITFHYVQPREMLLMDYFVYNFRAPLADRGGRKRTPLTSGEP